MEELWTGLCFPSSVTSTVPLPYYLISTDWHLNDKDATLCGRKVTLCGIRCFKLYTRYIMQYKYNLCGLKVALSHAKLLGCRALKCSRKICWC